MKDKIVDHEIGKDSLYKIWHASDEHLFMYIHSDGGSIVSGERVFPIKSGVLVYIAAGAYHYTMPDYPEKYDRSKLVVSKVSFDKMEKTFQDNTTFKNIVGKAVVYARIDECDREEVERLFTKSDDELTLMSCLLRLMYFLDKYTIESTPVVTGLMSRAVKYINENIASDLDVDSISLAINISKYYFCRQFKKNTGMTVMKYILKTRIVLAKNDLDKTGLSVSEISERYGFSSVSYFCRAFKEEENCSPLQYRKQNNN